MRILAVLVGGVVAVRAIVRVRVVLAAGILVMPDCHALSCSNSGHPLDRYGHGKQQDSKNAEKNFTHRRALYASCFERYPSRGFPREGHR
jgi:hypothetical protein